MMISSEHHSQMMKSPQQDNFFSSLAKDYMDITQDAKHGRKSKRPKKRHRRIVSGIGAVSTLTQDLLSPARDKNKSVLSPKLSVRRKKGSRKAASKHKAKVEEPTLAVASKIGKSFDQ